MKKISLWARQHRWQTRVLIVVIYIILNGIGLFVGDLLFLSGLSIPSSIIYTTCFVFLLGFISYPSKKDKAAYKNFYRRQKLTDFVLISTTFLLVVSYGNHYNTAPSLSQSPFHSLYALANKPVPTILNKNATEEKPVIKKKKGIKNLKQKLRENIRLLKKEYKDASKGEKAALIILSVLIALGLFFLLAALSCNISCSGSEGAATVILLLGTALIVFLLVKVIKRINRGKPKEQTSATSTTG